MLGALSSAQITAKMNETRDVHVSKIVGHINNKIESSDKKFESNCSILDSFYKDRDLKDITFL